MTSRDDFTPAEWEALQAGPVRAGILVMMSDPRPLGMIRELATMARAIKKTKTAGPARPLVKQLVRDMKNDDPDVRSDLATEDAKRETLDEVAAAAAIVDAKSPVDVAWGYKQYVMGVAQATAEASKEGSFFGIGGTRVTDKEQELLNAIRGALRV